MKKLNASEVSNVIGGNVYNCVITYERQTTGTGTPAVTVCRRQGYRPPAAIRPVRFATGR
ncbi:DUF4762 family protein [Serratia fonticola]|nr:DUF4762 family protein [Serratia fonticola]NYA38594.1 DUF4762 family protein [Serratia fonticola]